jgi:hypothetical protein
MSPYASEKSGEKCGRHGNGKEWARGVLHGSSKLQRTVQYEFGGGMMSILHIYLIGDDVLG